MAQRISPRTVNVTNVTKKGECKVNITLDLNINLTSDEINVARPAGPPSLEKEEDKIKDFEWVMPDFTGGDEKINFGKEV